MDALLVMILVLAVGAGPNFLRNELVDWNTRAKDKFHWMRGMNLSGEGVSVKFEIPTLTTREQGPAPKEPALDFQPDIEQITHAILGNLIENGDFRIPFPHELSGWGNGLYSDRFKMAYGVAPFWINFFNADIRASIETTDKGYALKIAHLSETADHSVGVMEQFIDVIPGIYHLTFWAKADASFESEGLQFFTTDEWRVTDKESPNIKRGFEIKKGGPFDWQQFSGEIQIDEPGERTFAVVSSKKGTVWVRDIVFVKTSGL